MDFMFIPIFFCVKHCENSLSLAHPKKNKIWLSIISTKKPCIDLKSIHTLSQRDEVWKIFKSIVVTLVTLPIWPKLMYFQLKIFNIS